MAAAAAVPAMASQHFTGAGQSAADYFDSSSGCGQKAHTFSSTEVLPPTYSMVLISSHSSPSLIYSPAAKPRVQPAHNHPNPTPSQALTMPSISSDYWDSSLEISAALQQASYLQEVDYGRTELPEQHSVPDSEVHQYGALQQPQYQPSYHSGSASKLYTRRSQSLLFYSKPATNKTTAGTWSPIPYLPEPRPSPSGMADNGAASLPRLPTATWASCCRQ